MEKKRTFKTPHTFVILMALILLAVIATYVVPAGEFTRFEDPVTGRTLVEAGSYVTIASNPISFLQIPVLVYKAIVKAASTVTFILVIGGAFGIINATGALESLCKVLARIFSNKKMLVVPVFLALFAVFGTTMGMSSEVMIFIPMGIALTTSLGMDRMTGMSMIMLGANSGFTAGLLNPFNVGVAQEIAEVPLFSGRGYRALILIVLLAVDTAYLLWYEKRIQKDPSRNVLLGEDIENEFVFDESDAKMTTRQKLVLVEVLIGLAVLIWGLGAKGWYFEEMSGLFLTMGVVAGLIAGFGPNKIASVFGKGAAEVTVGALIVGIARGVEMALADASILDTIIYGISNAVNALPDSLKAVGMFLAQSLVNCVITSGTGQAAVTMPLMTPVSDLIGISRQTAVLAFQLGDGFSNTVLPTASSLMGVLAVSKVPYAKWIKYMMPLFLIWTLLGCLFMLGALAIGF